MAMAICKDGHFAIEITSLSKYVTGPDRFKYMGLYFLDLFIGLLPNKLVCRTWWICPGWTHHFLLLRVFRKREQFFRAWWLVGEVSNSNFAATKSADKWSPGKNAPENFRFKIFLEMAFNGSFTLATFIVETVSDTRQSPLYLPWPPWAARHR